MPRVKLKNDEVSENFTSKIVEFPDRMVLFQRKTDRAADMDMVTDTDKAMDNGNKEDMATSMAMVINNVSIRKPINA